MSPTPRHHDSYATRLRKKQVAGEVLLREGSTYAAYRSRSPLRLIMADTTYAGQLNVRTCSPVDVKPGRHWNRPDSFYELDADGNRSAGISTDCTWVSSPTRSQP